MAEVWFRPKGASAESTERLFILNVDARTAEQIASNLEAEFGVTAWVEVKG